METEKQKPALWPKSLLYVALGILALAAWVTLSVLTVQAKEKAEQYGQRKYQEARAWVLIKLDAPTSIVISDPASQESVDELIIDAAKASGISPILVRSLIKVESGFKQDAIGFNAGLEGKYSKMVAADHSYMQVSGRWAGSEVCPEVHSWSDLYDAKKNINCGTAILKDALKSARSVTDALSVYNCGRTECEKGQQYAAKIAVEVMNNMKVGQ